MHFGWLFVYTLIIKTVFCVIILNMPMESLDTFVMKMHTIHMKCFVKKEIARKIGDVLKLLATDKH